MIEWANPGLRSTRLWACKFSRSRAGDAGLLLSRTRWAGQNHCWTDGQYLLSFDKERARTQNQDPQCYRPSCSVGLSPSRGLLRHGVPKALLFGQYESDTATKVWLQTGFCPAVRPISGPQLLKPNAKIESLLLFEQSLQRQIALGDVAGIAWETGLIYERIVRLS